MTKLSIAPKGSSDASYAAELEAFARRISTTPPGLVPLRHSFPCSRPARLKRAASACRAAMACPSLPRWCAAFSTARATAADLDRARVLAEMIRDASDCAIGYEAAAQFLAGLKAHADEYASHIENRACTEGTEQKVPCEALCPAHVNVPAYIALVAAGDYAGAVNHGAQRQPAAHRMRACVRAPVRAAVVAVACSTLPLIFAASRNSRSIPVRPTRPPCLSGRPKPTVALR